MKPSSVMQQLRTRYEFSEYFRLEEFACPCCGRKRASGGLIIILESIRAYVRRPIIVHGPQGGGYRCPELMAKMIADGKSNETSLHALGEAADIHCAGISYRQLYEIADRLNPCGGVGLYPWGVHVDTGKGKGKRRWGA